MKIVLQQIPKKRKRKKPPEQQRKKFKLIRRCARARARVCVCVCVCVRACCVCVASVIVKCPVLPPCVVEGRSEIFIIIIIVFVRWFLVFVSLDIIFFGTLLIFVSFLNEFLTNFLPVSLI